jgi:hypothetical protein
VQDYHKREAAARIKREQGGNWGGRGKAPLISPARSPLDKPKAGRTETTSRGVRQTEGIRPSGRKAAVRGTQGRQRRPDTHKNIDRSTIRKSTLHAYFSLLKTFGLPPKKDRSGRHLTNDWSEGAQEQYKKVKVGLGSRARSSEEEDARKELGVTSNYSGTKKTGFQSDTKKAILHTLLGLNKSKGNPGTRENELGDRAITRRGLQTIKPEKKGRAQYKEEQYEGVTAQTPDFERKPWEGRGEEIQGRRALRGGSSQ